MAGSAGLFLSACARRDPSELLNVSFDATRELYGKFNELFLARAKREGLRTRAVKQSHGGSGKQARSVLEGLQADVVTLALPFDIDALAKRGRIDRGWRSRLPFESAPFTSTIVFLVRQGNPKGIKGWADLVRDGVSVVTPNPKTSGGARWNYLAAWGWAARQGGEAGAEEYLRRLFQNVPVLDSGARGALQTFATRKIGDALLAWESEARLAKDKMAKENLEIVTPDVSILADTPVTIVDTVVDRRGTRVDATRYLETLFEAEAQALGAKFHFRPQDSGAGKDAHFPELERVRIEDIAGTWDEAHQKHFAAGGLFDSIFEERAK